MAHKVGKFNYEGSYYECLQSFDAGPFTVTERRFPAHFRERCHFHHQPYLHGIIDGSLTESGILHDKGSVGFQPIGEHVSTIHDRGLHTVVIEIDRGALENLTAAPRAALNSSLPELRLKMAALVRELRQPDAFTPLAVEGVALELLAITLRHAARPELSAPRWLRRVEERVRLGAAERLTLESLASDACVHPVTLSRAFHRTYGQSLVEYARDARLEKARRLLGARDMPIAMIAAETGFTDQSHLARCFRKRYGVSPAEYRSIHT
jgi:AraC-like DNA-binding protein